jgi:hypothetical protein
VSRQFGNRPLQRSAAGCRFVAGTIAIQEQLYPCSVEPQKEGERMTRIVYEIVEHDGGWAYKLGDVYSETFANRSQAYEAAKAAAAEQRLAGRTEGISYQDEEGEWHEEVADGRDRPETDVSAGG